jgi:hypothetical protein
VQKITSKELHRQLKAAVAAQHYLEAARLKKLIDAAEEKKKEKKQASRWAFAAADRRPRLPHRETALEYSHRERLHEERKEAAKRKKNESDESWVSKDSEKKTMSEKEMDRMTEVEDAEGFSAAFKAIVHPHLHPLNSKKMALGDDADSAEDMNDTEVERHSKAWTVSSPRKKKLLRAAEKPLPSHSKASSSSSMSVKAFEHDHGDGLGKMLKADLKKHPHKALARVAKLKLAMADAIKEEEREVNQDEKAQDKQDLAELKKHQKHYEIRKWRRQAAAVARSHSRQASDAELNAEASIEAERTMDRMSAVDDANGFSAAEKAIVHPQPSETELLKEVIADPHQEESKNDEARLLSLVTPMNDFTELPAELKPTKLEPLKYAPTPQNHFDGVLCTDCLPEETDGQGEDKSALPQLGSFGQDLLQDPEVKHTTPAAVSDLEMLL